MTSFDDIQHPVARQTLSEHDGQLAGLQDRAGELARMKDTLTEAIGHPGLAELLGETLDGIGGALQDQVTAQRARIREIADMQREGEAEEQKPGTDRDADE